MEGEADAQSSPHAHANCAIHVRDRRWWRVDVAGEAEKKLLLPVGEVIYMRAQVMSAGSP
jgi:hypothetical protein